MHHFLTLKYEGETSLVIQGLRLCFQCRRQGFNLWLEDWDPTCHTVWDIRDRIYPAFNIRCFINILFSMFLSPQMLLLITTLTLCPRTWWIKLSADKSRTAWCKSTSWVAESCCGILTALCLSFFTHETNNNSIIIAYTWQLSIGKIYNNVWHTAAAKYLLASVYCYSISLVIFWW